MLVDSAVMNTSLCWTRPSSTSTIELKLFMAQRTRSSASEKPFTEHQDSRMLLLDDPGKRLNRSGTIVEECGEIIIDRLKTSVNLRVERETESCSFSCQTLKTSVIKGYNKNDTDEVENPGSEDADQQKGAAEKAPAAADNGAAGLRKHEETVDKDSSEFPEMSTKEAGSIYH
ncbi:DNA replication licensing factor MCM6 [Raphanus sativus]|nr:DNA replication licensing factor MCM6 [Raphanus sativus]